MLAKHLFGPLRLVAVLLLGLGAGAESVSLAPKLAKEKGESIVEIWDGDRCALKTPPGGILRVFVSGKETPATLEGAQAGAGRVELGGQTAEGLGVTDTFESIGPALVRRTTRFTAKADLSFF